MSTEIKIKIKSRAEEYDRREGKGEKGVEKAAIKKEKNNRKAEECRRGGERNEEK